MLPDPGGQGVHWPAKYLEDQLTLFQPGPGGRADYPHLLLLTQIFSPSGITEVATYIAIGTRFYKVNVNFFRTPMLEFWTYCFLKCTLSRQVRVNKKQGKVFSISAIFNFLACKYFLTYSSLFWHSATNIYMMLRTISYRLTFFRACNFTRTVEMC